MFEKLPPDEGIVAIYIYTIAIVFCFCLFSSAIPNITRAAEVTRANVSFVRSVHEQRDESFFPLPFLFRPGQCVPAIEFAFLLYY